MPQAIIFLIDGTRVSVVAVWYPTMQGFGSIAVDASGQRYGIDPAAVWAWKASAGPPGDCDEMGKRLQHHRRVWPSEDAAHDVVFAPIVATLGDADYRRRPYWYDPEPRANWMPRCP